MTRGDNLVNGGKYGDYEFGAVQLEPSEREVQAGRTRTRGRPRLRDAHVEHVVLRAHRPGISDNSGVYARNGWFAFYGSSPRPIAQAERFYDDSAFTQEFRLVSKGGEFVDWTAGLFYTDQDYDLGQNSYLVGYIPYLNAHRPGTGSRRTRRTRTSCSAATRRTRKSALFGEATINFTDDLHLTLGGRYFDNSVDVDALVDVPIYADAYERRRARPRRRSTTTSFLFKANFAWDVTDDSMLYATYSQGYRHAGANAVPTTGKYAENPDYFTFDSDSVDNYELGYKGVTDLLNFAVSLYYTDWQDPQLNTATSNWGFFAAINGESARTQGIEVELSGGDHRSADLQRRLHLRGRRAHRRRVPAGRQFLRRPVVHRQGRPRTATGCPARPSTSSTCRSATTSTFGNGIGMNAVLSGYYQSDVLNSIGDDNCFTTFTRARQLPRQRQPGVGVLCARLGVLTQLRRDRLRSSSGTSARPSRSDDWGVSLYVKNLFNDEGTTGAFPFLAGGSNTSPSQNYFGNNSRDFIALPRTFGMALTYSF